MDSHEIKIFFDLLNEDEYCLLYNGNFIDAVTSKIINISKVNLIQRGELIKIQNRLAYLIAECFQNIIRHGGHKNREVNNDPLPGFFMTKIKNNYYDLVTSNLIDNAKIPPLKNIFNKLNALNKDELKALYNKTLAEGQLSDKGGAGVGLIDMAKKSALLEYKFINTSDHDSLFYQRLVMTSGVDMVDRKGKDNSINFGVMLHNAMIDHNILVLQKSDFSRGTILPMLDIVEQNIITKENNAVLIKVIYKILIELIQNINRGNFKHKDHKEGLFLISKNEESYSICSGYYIDNKKIDWLKCLIERILSMNNEELTKTYLNQLNLSENIIDNSLENKAINIEQIIAKRFSYSFYEVSNAASIFSICANI